jgi:energy-coupling factor transport system substrate-specific component
MEAANGMKRRALSTAIYALTTAIGLVAFLYPFLLPSLRSNGIGLAHSGDAPLLLTALVGLAFVVLLLEVQGQAVNAKFIALLGVLVAMNSVLRFLEIAVPGPGGVSPIFFLIILAGYVYGGRFGFLMGALTLLVSGLITGSLGPWLPYQMLTAGWVGMSAPLARPLARRLAPRRPYAEVVVLALLAAVWGFLFGAIMNIWFWPFASGAAGQAWQPGMGVGTTLARYGTFYLATSALWDGMRAAGNVVLVLAFGAPTVRALERFRRRFAFVFRPSAPDTEAERGTA